MNREDIIRMAREAGIAKHGLGWTCWEGQLERFAALVAAHEREECAKIADEYAKVGTGVGGFVAAAIRARENT